MCRTILASGNSKMEEKNRVTPLWKTATAKLEPVSNARSPDTPALMLAHPVAILFQK